MRGPIKPYTLRHRWSEPGLEDDPNDSSKSLCDICQSSPKPLTSGTALTGPWTAHGGQRKPAVPLYSQQISFIRNQQAQPEVCAEAKRHWTRHRRQERAPRKPRHRVASQPLPVPALREKRRSRQKPIADTGPSEISAVMRIHFETPSY